MWKKLCLQWAIFNFFSRRRKGKGGKVAAWLGVEGRREHLGWVEDEVVKALHRMQIWRVLVAGKGVKVLGRGGRRLGGPGRGVFEVERRRRKSEFKEKKKKASAADARAKEFVSETCWAFRRRRKPQCAGR